MVELTIVFQISGACPREWHALAACCWPRHKFKCTNYACKALITQLSVNHVSARLAMKTVELHRDLQSVENE